MSLLRKHIQGHWPSIKYMKLWTAALVHQLLLIRLWVSLYCVTKPWSSVRFCSDCSSGNGAVVDLKSMIILIKLTLQWSVGITIVLTYSLICVNCRGADQQVAAKVAYIEFDDSTSAGVSLHLTNTVFIDRALMVVPVMDGEFGEHINCHPHHGWWVWWTHKLSLSWIVSLMNT